MARQTPSPAYNLDHRVNNFAGMTAVGTQVISFAGEADTAPSQCGSEPFPQQTTNNTWTLQTLGYLFGDSIWVEKHFSGSQIPLKRNFLTSVRGCPCVYGYGGYNVQCNSEDEVVQTWPNQVITTRVVAL